VVVALTSTIHPSGLVDGAGKAGGGPRLRPVGKEGEGGWGGVRGNGAVGLGKNEGGRGGAHGRCRGETGVGTGGAGVRRQPGSEGGGGAAAVRARE
jgi:hypothetical protein